MNDDDLRHLFQDATSQVRPQGTLDDIRDRTKKVDPMTRRWFLSSLAAAAVMATVIGGAFWITRETTPDNDSATIAGTPSQDPSSAAPANVETEVLYVGDGARGPRLFAEVHSVRNLGGDLALAAATEAVSGTPIDNDYRQVWPAGLSVDAVSFDQDLITVDFADGAAADLPSGTEQADAAAAVNALVRTVQAAYQNEAAVEFTIAGEAAATILGVDTTTPLTGGNDDDVLALVSISDLADGATVEAGKLTVTGFAAAFEANVSWEILVGGDAVIDSGFTTAQECCTLAPFSFTTNIELEGPGTYTLVVHDTDESGLGGAMNQDTKEIVVE